MFEGTHEQIVQEMKDYLGIVPVDEPQESYDGISGTVNIPINSKRIYDDQLYNWNGSSWDSLGFISATPEEVPDSISTPVIVDTPQEEIKIIKGNREPSPYKKGHVITVELLDSADEPWDPEKHSSTKSKTADGKWKKKRKTKKAEAKPEEPSLAKEIMAECSRLLSADADMLEITTAALAHAGFEDQSKVWVPDAPKEKLEKYLEYLKSK